MEIDDVRAMSADPVTADPRIRTFGLLIEAQHRLTSRLDDDLRRTDGIPLQTLEVLLRLSRAPDGVMTMADLAGQVALSAGGLTRLADRLSADGLVERRGCPTDRRRVHLGLTDHGTRVLERALSNHLVALDAHMATRIPETDLPAFERVLEALRV